MISVERTDLFSLPEGLSVKPVKSAFDNFVTQVHGDVGFAKIHADLYPRVVVRHTKTAKNVTLQDLNYQIYLFNLIVVSLVSDFEDFMEVTCRKALLQRHNLFGRFNPSVSWKQIPASGNVDTIWEALADQVLASLTSGKLRTFSGVFNKLGVKFPSPRGKQGKALEELSRRRNVIVHNKNVPDKQYLEIISSPKTYPSGGLAIDISYIEQAGDLLINISRNIIDQLVKKRTLKSSELEVS